MVSRSTTSATDPSRPRCTAWCSSMPPPSSSRPSRQPCARMPHSRKASNWILGEIACFGPDKRRTNIARCASASTVLMVDEVTLKQLTFQNPSFGFHLILETAVPQAKSPEKPAMAR